MHEYEKKLGEMYHNLIENVFKKPEGKKLRNINDDEEKQIVEIIRCLRREYDLGEGLRKYSYLNTTTTTEANKEEE